MVGVVAGEGSLKMACWVLTDVTRRLNSKRENVISITSQTGAENDNPVSYSFESPFPQCFCEWRNRGNTHTRVQIVHVSFRAQTPGTCSHSTRLKKAGVLGRCDAANSRPSPADHSHSKDSTSGGCRDLEPAIHPPSTTPGWPLVAGPKSHVNESTLRRRGFHD